MNETLRQREENISITLNSIGDAVIATDAAGLITRMNPVAERLTGWPLADAMGQPLTAVFHIISAETRLPSVNPVQLVMDHGQVVGLANHTALIARGGQEYQIADSAAPIRDATDAIVGVVLVFSDVTKKYLDEMALKKTTDRLFLAVRAGKVGIWEWDIINNQLVWDDGMYRLYGIASSQFSSAYDAWRNGVHPDDRARGDAEGQLALRGEKEYDTEFRVLWPDGSIHTIRALAIVQRDNAGQPLKMIGTNWDITERKRAEAERASLEVQLRESQKMQAIGTLAGGIAHDFNNILAAILGNADLMRQDLTANPEAMESLEEISKASRRGRDLVQQILAFSRRQPVELKPMALAPLVEDSARLLRSTLSAYLDPGEALAALRANPASFDLVVSDYNMPGMSGLEVAREARAIRADLPVVVASGFVDEALQTQAKAAGVREVISKTKAMDGFCEVIARIANAQSAKAIAS